MKTTDTPVFIRFFQVLPFITNKDGLTFLLEIYISL